MCGSGLAHEGSGAVGDAQGMAPVYWNSPNPPPPSRDGKGANAREQWGGEMDCELSGVPGQDDSI